VEEGKKKEGRDVKMVVDEEFDISSMAACLVLINS